ncbi:unnamed protein product, partial [Linum tenue]
VFFPFLLSSLCLSHLASTLIIPCPPALHSPLPQWPPRSELTTMKL